MQSLDINNPASIYEYSSQLDDLRLAAVRTPLRRGTKFDLTLSLPDLAQPRDDNRRRVPQSFYDRQLNTSTTWYLVKPLKSGHVPVVWLASTNPSASIDADSAPNDAGDFIVLKVLQASLIDHPRVEWPRYYLEAYQTPEQIATKVEEVYRRMSEFQGRTLTYFFGREKRTAPNGEEIEILMFEYIHGANLETVMDNYEDPRFAPWISWSHLQPLAQSVLDTIKAAHSRHIIHRDIKPENFVMDNEGKWVVVIDWEFCSVDHVASEDLIAYFKNNDKVHGCNVFLKLSDCTHSLRVAVQWANTVDPHKTYKVTLYD